MTQRDTLKQLLDAQQVFMRVLGIDTTTATELTDERVNSVILGLASEVGEVAQAYNVKTRHWANSGTDEAFANLGAEAIDVLFYLLELYALIGFSSQDILCAYRDKLVLNLKRILRTKGRQTAEIAVALYVAGGVGDRSSPTINAIDLLTKMRVMPSTQLDAMRWLYDEIFRDE